MIKLFWNTHNQKKPNSPEKKIREKQELDYGWGKYHKKSSDKWVFEILKKVEYQIIKSEEELKKEDILIIVDSSVEEKSELYNKLNLISSKIFLFLLGDEFGFHILETLEKLTYQKLGNFHELEMKAEAVENKFKSDDYTQDI